jgi:hypothetical protein
MLYVVTGANQATGAKTRLEIDAANRAAAERAAQRSGVEVLHCHAANEDPVTRPHVRHAAPTEPVCEGRACAKLLALGGLVLAGVIGWLLL